MPWHPCTPREDTPEIVYIGTKREKKICSNFFPWKKLFVPSEIPKMAEFEKQKDDIVFP